MVLKCHLLPVLKIDSRKTPPGDLVTTGLLTKVSQRYARTAGTGTPQVYGTGGDSRLPWSSPRHALVCH